MTVKQFNPNSETPVEFSTKALAHLQKQVIKSSAMGIIFNVKESGCSGYKYLLELAFELDGNENIYRLNDNLDLYVKSDIVQLIRGTQVDYVQEGVNFRLDFKNPNATASCGCGESFSVTAQS
jgi:iron-sulfur cluster assembly accessory protein